MMVCPRASTSECFEKAQSLQLQGSSSPGRSASGRVERLAHHSRGTGCGEEYVF